MINIDTHFFLEAHHVDFLTTIKERSWFANATNHDAFRAVSNLLWYEPTLGREITCILSFKVAEHSFQEPMPNSR